MMFVDPDGEWAFLIPILVAAAKGAAIAAAVNATAQLAMTGQIDWNSVATSTLSGVFLEEYKAQRLAVILEADFCQVQLDMDLEKLVPGV